MSAYSSLIISDSPVAYWPLGESSGTSAVDQMGVQNGVYNLSGCTQGIAGPLFNDPGTAVHLDGTTNGNISIADAAALDLTGDFSVEAWLRTSSQAALQFIYDASASTNQGYGLVLGSGQPEVRVGGIVYTPIGQLVADGSWHHVVATLASTTAAVYVDGLVSTAITSPVPTSNPGTRYIGRNALTGVFKFLGDLCHVAVYAYALNPNRIVTHYHAGVPSWNLPVSHGGH